MWFLLVKIFFLLCLAALLGAATAWWWMRRKFVDVTESHLEQTKQLDAFLKQGKAISKDDVDKSLTAAFDAYRPPEPDLKPIQQKLFDIEYAMATPSQDVAALHDRMHGLEQSVSAISASVASMRTVHLEAIDQHLRGVSARIDNLRMPDMDGVNSRISALSSHISESRLPDMRAAIEPRLDRLENMLTNLRIPATDLGPVHSGLAALQVAVENLEIPEPNLSPLHQKIDAITRDPGINTVLERLGVLEAAMLSFEFPETDLDPLAARLAAIETRLATIATSDSLMGTLIGIESDLDVLSRRSVDLNPVLNQFDAVDASLASIRSELRGQGRNDVIERRLSALQESVLTIPQPDYSRIDLALRSMESTFDIGALEDRLTAIEYGLTAVHHMLRSRSETPRAEPEVRVRAEPAPVAEPRPAARPARVAQAEPRAVRRADPIARARRPDDKANLLTHAAFGAGDELEQIVGVGPMLAELLNDVGVYYFWQIAEWTGEDIDFVDGKLLHFRGRIERDDWVGQSKQLAALATSASRPLAD